MRMLIAIATALAVMAAIVVGVVAVATTLTRGAEAAVARVPASASTLARVAFGLLVVLVAGVASGLIGGAS